ncbi:MAG: hypothetical protein L0Y75_03105 [Acidobacteria bacterium]|nr:hypothetical protein [Acidobacteriota bacterium]
MNATEQAIAALRAAARFADFVAETSGDEDAIRLHRQCTEAIGALREERSGKRAASDRWRLRRNHRRKNHAFQD